MSNAVTIYEGVNALTVQEVKSHVQLIQQVMKDVMIEKEHYGTIPGCGSKKTLLKPGAEKIAATFRLAADPEVTDLSTEYESTFRVTCRLTTHNGTFVGAGVGQCSSKEKKYAWRTAVCHQEYEATPEDRRQLKWNADGTYIEQIREEPADKANTILKMAKKRALVDAVLTATAASDIFTQDLEDDDLSGAVGDEHRQHKAPQQNGDTVAGYVDNIDTKTGTSNGKNWTCYFITIGGEKFATFDSAVHDAAARAKDAGVTVSGKWKQGAKGKQLLSLE